tara:strand:+ start:346 stop:1236 length:891 start_codon:yes stop_codon:yes gene_type:complete
MNNHHKPIDYIRTIVFILIAVLIAIGASDGSLRYKEIPIIFIIMGSSFFIHWLVFIPSFIYRTEKYYDLTGMIAYLVAVLLSLYLLTQTSEVLSIRTNVVSIMVCLWTLRLGLFLFQRIKIEKEDKRFKNIKTSFSGFLFAWTVSSTWVCLTASNAFTMIIANSNLIGDIYFILGSALWAFGFVFEIISDQQKKTFKLNKLNKDKFINTGLWSISRHPNYFGEITLWLGISIISFPILMGWQFVTLISPLFVYLLLTRVSGINMLEKRSDDQWGDELEYKNYKNNTPVLIPFYGPK